MDGTQSAPLCVFHEKRTIDFALHRYMKLGQPTGAERPQKFFNFFLGSSCESR